MSYAQNNLNEYGEVGWELVSIIQHSDAKQFFPNRDSDFFAFFKKQKAGSGKPKQKTY